MTLILELTNDAHDIRILNIGLEDNKYAVTNHKGNVRSILLLVSD